MLSEELRRELRAIDHRGYPAYKGLAGRYQFPGYVLSIDHVQGDPFASPSHLSVFVPHASAGFAPELFQSAQRQTALEDFLLRRFGGLAERFCFAAKGSGKSGLISVSRCGQEVLKRTACEVAADGIWLRFHVGFPANGRSINAGELEKILFEFIPACVKGGLQMSSYTAADQSAVQKVVELADDQMAVRAALQEQGLVAFVADGAILPRKSGVSDKPMTQGVPFRSPESLRVTLNLPHRGSISGMGIPKGITLIAGGGYHGKSTLLKALEMGVYNHIAGDGREFVITEDTALKLRAEDGRYIRDTDISLFINDLPNGKDTVHFSTEDASGSTSQAAGIVEGILAGCQTFLIDEDTSAANFMVRDALMQEVVSRKKEPITPFVERARGCYEQLGISTILVAGSSGAFFSIADTIIQMDAYQALDITERVREILKSYEGMAGGSHVPAFRIPGAERPYDAGRQRIGDAKIKQFDRDSFSVDKNTVNLHAVEQLADTEQTAALGYLLRYACTALADGKRSLADVVKALKEKEAGQGFSALMRECKGGAYVPSGFAAPRAQEIYACLARYRRG